MRMLHPDGQVVHLAYCTNVHPAEDLDGVLAQLDRFAVPVRRALGVDVLGLGLWLAAPLAADLAGDPQRLDQLRTALQTRGLEVVTFNGFPYRGFQERVVKHAVYQPDWTSHARFGYTADLIRVLAELMPDDATRGSISTLPLGWRSPWYGDRQQAAVANLERLGEELDRVRQSTGRTIRVGLEPEPGCVIETTADAVERLADVQHPGVGVCLDACHLAVAFENPQTAVRRLQAAGLPIVKAQAAAALHVADPADAATRTALAAFDEPRFLHQVRQDAGPDLVPLARDDLGEALDGDRSLSGREGAAARAWRVHFHAPLGATPQPPVLTTTEHLRATLGELLGGPLALTDHVEAETYTWSVLPEHARPTDDAALATSIAAELSWLRDTLLDLGLKEIP